MTILGAVKNAFKNYARFSGRACVKEYWYFFLFNMIVFCISSIFSSVAAKSSFFGFLNFVLGMYSLAAIIPGLAVCCRRLHDTGRSGACMLYGLIPLVGIFILLIWLAKEGTQGDNKYGSSSRAVLHDIKSPENKVQSNVCPTVVAKPTSAPAFTKETPPCSNKKICPYCDSYVDLDANFCVSCGKKIVSDTVVKAPPTPPKHCANCGSMVNPAYRFCTNCGNKLDVIETANNADKKSEAQKYVLSRITDLD